MNTSQIKALLQQEGAGRHDSTHGPNEFGTLMIWEVWTYLDGEYHARFIVSAAESEPPRYFEGFQRLCTYLNENHKIADLEERRHTRSYRMIVLWVAALVFLGSVAAFIIFIFCGLKVGWTSLSLLGGIIASGATMFFGAWKLPKLSG